MLASDPVFRKVYEALERHDDRVTIVTTKSHDALTTICAVAASSASIVLHYNEAQSVYCILVNENTGNHKLRKGI